MMLAKIKASRGDFKGKPSSRSAQAWASFRSKATLAVRKMLEALAFLGKR